MRIPRLAGRLFGACATGLAFVAACAGAAPGAPPGELGAGLIASSPLVVEPLNPSASAVSASKQPEPGAKADAGPPADAGADPRCPYGELNDPHRGFVRCLLPEERDAGWLPPPSQEPPSAPDAGPSVDAGDAGDAGKEVKIGPPPAVEIGAPVFENGEVGRAEKVLNTASADIGKCVAEHGGLSGAAGNLKVQFLVRSRGRAEGVEVLASKGVSPEAAVCVRQLLKNKAIGPPTADPVGVTVTISFKAAAK